jgi:O-methyltransferase involved in polyketide biosynthesis
VKAGAITVRPEVIAFEKGRAVYTRNADKAVKASVDSDEIDAVIFATGYESAALQLHYCTCLLCVSF